MQVKHQTGYGKQVFLLLGLSIALVASFMVQQHFNRQAYDADTFEDVTELDHSSPYGGNGGNSFADHPNGKMTGIHIRSGTRIDSIGAQWGNKKAIHGGNGGNNNKFIDTSNVCINRITVRANKEVDSLIFHGFYLKGKRTYQSKQFGGSGGKQYSVKLGGCLNGFFGRSNKRVDKIGFVSLKELTSLRGSWKLVESYSGDIDYYIEEKTIKSSSNSMDKQTATQYSVSASASYGFAGFGATVSSSYANQKYLREQFKSYQYSSTFTKKRRNCKAPTGGKHSAQIWQFLLDGSANDGKTIAVATKHFVCSSSKYKAPMCVPEKCANGVCSKCK